MRIDQRWWLYYLPLAVTFSCSLASLFALIELGSPSWTNSVNGLSIACVLLASKFRPGAVNANDQ
jgi:hypothetical protein